MKVDLPDDIAAALIALARLDGISTEERAAAIIRDFLAGLAEPTRRVADALAALADDHETSGAGEDVPPSPEPTPDTLSRLAGGDPDIGAGPGALVRRRATDVDGSLPADNGSPSDEEVDDAPSPVTPDDPGGGQPSGEGPPPATTFQCDEPGCGFVAATKQQLGGHRGSHRRRRKPDGCQLDDCTDTPVKARGLCARHYRAWEDGRLRVAPDGAPSPAAPPEDDRHLCEDCGQTFKTAAGLGSHRRSHVRSPEPRICGNCGETAAKNQPLRQGRCKRCDAYWRQHGEERPTPDDDGTYRCPDCGDSFETAAGVGVHRGRFCKPEAATDRCEECGGPVPGGVGRWCGVGRCVAGDSEKPWSWSRRAP